MLAKFVFLFCLFSKRNLQNLNMPSRILCDLSSNNYKIVDVYLESLMEDCFLVFVASSQKTKMSNMGVMNIIMQKYFGYFYTLAGREDINK